MTREYPGFTDPNSTESTLSDAEIYTVLTFTERVIVSTVVIITTTCGFVGNTTVIASILLSKRLRTVCNAFVFNLCVADLLTCLAGPWMAVAFMSVDGWKLPDVICSGISFIGISCIGCSIYTLATIAVSRLILISCARPSYEAFYTRKTIAVIISITWVVPTAMASLPPIFGVGNLGYDKRFSSCTWDPTHPLSRTYSLLLSAVIYPVPLMIISVSYAMVFAKIRRHNRVIAVNENLSVSKSSGSGDPNSTPGGTASGVTPPPHRIPERQLQVTRNMFLIVLAFVVCLTPYGASLIATNSDEFIVYGALIMVANSSINPIIYSTKHPELKYVMKCVILCQFRLIRR